MDRRPIWKKSTFWADVVNMMFFRDVYRENDWRQKLIDLEDDQPEVEEPELNRLYRLVTEAITKAEIFADDGDARTERAYGEVSKLEEKIAELIPVDNPEGRMARSGAIRAAIASGDRDRAIALTRKYRDEVDEILKGDVVASNITEPGALPASRILYTKEWHTAWRKRMRDNRTAAKSTGKGPSSS